MNPKPLSKMYYEIFHQASRTIRDNPFLANVKHLHTDHSFADFRPPQFPRFSAEVRHLFESLGPLEKLTTYGCDLRLYLNPSLNPSPGSLTRRDWLYSPRLENS